MARSVEQDARFRGIPDAAAESLRVGIVAGESSGDQLGAALIAALRARVPHMHCFGVAGPRRSEEHTSELQSRLHLVCRLLLEKKKTQDISRSIHLTAAYSGTDATTVGHVSAAIMHHILPTLTQLPYPNTHATMHHDQTSNHTR